MAANNDMADINEKFRSKYDSSWYTWLPHCCRIGCDNTSKNKMNDEDKPLLTEIKGKVLLTTKISSVKTWFYICATLAIVFNAVNFYLLYTRFSEVNDG